MDREYDLRMDGGNDDEFDEVEETTEYNDVEQDDGEYEYDDTEGGEEEDSEEEYAEDGEFDEEDPEDGEYDEEYPEEEDYSGDEDGEEEEGYAADGQDYENRFDQILSELKNLNQNLAGKSVQAYGQPFGAASLPGQTTPNFSCSYSVPQMQYADPVLTSEVSRMRDEVLRTSMQQSMQQNNTVLAEISRMREEMSKNNSQNLQFELMQLRHDLQNGRYPQTNAPAQGGESIQSALLQNELAHLKEDLSRNGLNGVNGEVARLRDEMAKKEMKESMDRRLAAMRKEMGDKSEIERVREEMGRLKQELVDAIDEKKHRQSSVTAEESFVPAKAADRTSEMMDMISELREEIRREKAASAERERRYDEAKSRGNSMPYAGNAEAGSAVLDEIKKLRSEVAQHSAASSELLSKKIDTALTSGAEEEKRTQEILRAIGKMFVSGNSAMKGLTDKNETMLKSFTEEIKKNIDEIHSVKDEIAKADMPAIRSHIDAAAARSGKEVAVQIGEQLGALAKDVISKVSDKDRQEEMYHSLMTLDQKMDANLRTQAKAYQENNRIGAGVAKLVKSSGDAVRAKLDETVKAAADDNAELARRVTEAITALQENWKKNPDAFADAGKILAEVESLKNEMKAFNDTVASRDTDAAAVSAIIEKMREEIAAGQSKVTQEIASLRGQQAAQGKRSTMMFGGIAKMIAKNNNILQDVLGETQKAVGTVLDGGKLTAGEIASLRGNIADIAAKDLAELVSIRKALTKLDDTEAVVTEINTRMANIVKDVARTVEALKEEIQTQLGEAERYTNVNKVLDFILDEVTANVTKLMASGVASMKAELAEEVTVSVRDLSDTVVAANDRMVKAVTRLESVSAEPMIAEMKEAAKRIDTVGAELKKELATNLDRNSAAYSELNKKTGEIRRTQDEQIKKNGQLMQSMARAVVATRNDVAKMADGFKSFNELRDSLAAINGSAVNELKALVNSEIDRLNDSLRNRIELGDGGEQIVKQINSLKTFMRENAEEKAEELGKNLEFRLNGLLTALTDKNSAANQAADALAIKLNELGNTLAKEGGDQIHGALKTLSDKVNQVTEELRANPISPEQLAKRMNAIKLEIGARIDEQEAKVLSSLRTQVGEIKTSLVDVLGQNEVIDSIAKNVRDVKSEISAEVAKLRGDFESNAVSGKLVQELISQINLLSEYMLQDSKAEDSAAVATQIAELKNKIVSSANDTDLKEIRDEIVALRNSLQDSAASDDMMMNLISQVNELTELGKKDANHPAMNKVMGSLEELNDQVQNLAKIVDMLKNKDMSVTVQDSGADVRMRATQVMLDKLTEIKFAIEDAIRKTGNKEQGIAMVKAIDKLTNQLGYQSGAPVNGGVFTRSLNELTDDLDEFPKK